MAPGYHGAVKVNDQLLCFVPCTPISHQKACQKIGAARITNCMEILSRRNTTDQPRKMGNTTHNQTKPMFASTRRAHPYTHSHSLLLGGSSVQHCAARPAMGD